MNSRKRNKHEVEILIAEDSATQREQLEHLLRARGYAVVAAANGKEALAAARRRMPALIVTDVLMPELDGYGLCKAIKSDNRLKDIPVMLLTTLSDPQDVIRGLECGADNFIRKPYEGDYLFSRIDYLLMNIELRKNQKMQMGVEINLGDGKYFITSERQQILDLLISTYEQAVHLNNQLKLREKDLAHSNQVLSGLYRIAEGLNQAVSEREVADSALERAMELPGIQSGWISLREGDAGFRLAAARNLPPALEISGALEGDCTCRRRLLSGELDSVTNILECERLGKATADTRGLRFHAAIPLWLGERTLGVMNLVGPEKGLFNDEELQVLFGVGNQVALALERARLHENLDWLVKERTAKLEAEIAERRRIEKEQARLTAIIEATPDMVATADPDGKVLYVNRAGLGMLGYDAGRDASVLRIRDSHPEWAAKLVLEEGIPHAIEHGTWSGETAFLQPGGREIPISQVIIAHKGVSGSVEYLSTVARDITERKRAEEAQGRLAAIVEDAEDAIISRDLENRVVTWNAAAERLFGYAAQEVIGRAIDFFIPPDQQAQVGQVRALLAEGRHIPPYETVRLAKDGRRIDVLHTLSPIRDASGQVIGASLTIRDITARKEAERRIREQLEHLNLLDQITRAIGERQDLRSIFQVVVRTIEGSMPLDFACVCLHDEPADVLMVACVGANSEALPRELAMDERASIDVDKNGLSRCMQGQLVYEPDIRQVAFPFPQRLARGGLGSLVLAPLRSESRVFGVLVAARRAARGFGSVECEFLRQLSDHVALAAHQAQLYGALQQAYDDLRQTQRAVMQQERLSALGQMASGIAHDINNAISPVSLYAESLLETEPNLSARARGYLQTIQRAVDDVAETVTRMREFYRQREPQVALVAVLVNPLVQQVIDLTHARWSDMPQQRGIVIRAQADLAPDLPKIMGIESEIREALTNLVFNAVDAMPEGGTLTLRSRLADAAEGGRAAVVIEVVDEGIGMDEDTRRRCLEPFFTTKGERGTGLGLAMVFGMAQRHSADLEIESAPGAGTTVRLAFAVAGTALAGTEQPAEAQAYGAPSRLRLLLVDDDPVLLKSLRDTLEADGHVVVTANGGEAGIAALRASLDRGEPFAAVITDLGMPHVDGRRVAAAVKQASPATPVMLLTGWGRRLIDEGDVPPHVDRVLAKPPKLSELREALAHLCRPAAS